jgi:hypothetical protein
MTDASVVFRGTDCLGDGGYEVGKNYLVYASEQDVQDVTLDGLPAGSFWYGWTDVLPKGTKMLASNGLCAWRENIRRANVSPRTRKGAPSRERIVRRMAI